MFQTKSKNKVVYFRAVSFVTLLVILLGLTTLQEALAKRPREVREKLRIHQNVYDVATDLHFKLWQKEDDIDIEDWRISNTSGHFNSVNSQRGDQPEPWHSKVDKLHSSSRPAPDNGRHAIDINCTGGNVPRCEFVEFDFWWKLTEWNTKRATKVEWTKTNGDPPQKKGLPNHGWQIKPPKKDPQNPPQPDPQNPGKWMGQWLHQFCFQNSDDTESIVLNGLKFSPQLYYVDLYDLSNVQWTLPMQDIILKPGEEFCYDIPANMPVNYILINYQLIRPDAAGLMADLDPADVLMEDTIEHQVDEDETIMTVIDTTTPPGDLVSVPIDLQLGTDLDWYLSGGAITDIQLALSYDPSKLDFSNLEPIGGAVEGWEFVPEMFDGHLFISMFHVLEPPVPLDTSGPFLLLNFNTLTKTKEQANIHLDGASLNGWEMPPSALSGGKVSTKPLCDVSGDGTTSAYDVAMLLQFLVGLIDLPIQPMVASSSNAPQSYTVSLPHTSVASGSLVEIPMTINNMTGLTAGAFVLRYNPAVVKPVSVEASKWLSEAYWDYNLKREGEVRIAFAGTQDVMDSGELLFIQFEALPGTDGQKSPITIQTAQFAEGQRIIKNDGWIEVLPSKFLLLQNYPNPFNPETWLPYKLAHDAEVSIHIYTFNGKLIQTIDVGHQPAGVYVEKNKAAYWDGRDSFGEKIASGMYYYTLQVRPLFVGTIPGIEAGEFRATRKMVIMK